MTARSSLEFSPGAAGPLLRLTPVTDPRDTTWRDFASCAQADPEAFFPEKGGSTREAKKVCRACPVNAQCLDWALEHDERFGIWGGLSEQERKRLKRGAPLAAVTHRTCTRCDLARPLTEFARPGSRICERCRLARDRERSQYRRDLAREAA